MAQDTMERVTIKKEELLKVIRENKEKHDTLLRDAVDGYWKKVGETLSTELVKVEKREGQGVNINLPYPISYEKDYTYALAVLEMSASSKIVLSKQEFQQYVLNEWGWRSNFVSTASNYLYSGYASTGAFFVK